MSGRTRHRDRGRRREDGDQRPAGSGGPRPIGNVVSGLMARFGYDREQAASQLESAWSEVVPEMLRSLQASRSVQDVLERRVTR